MLREELQLFDDAFGNRRREKRVINGARRQQQAKAHGDTSESVRKLFVHTVSRSFSRTINN
jgi:hypothetical protein